VSADLKLVNFRAEPGLADIAGQLRRLADEVERGEVLPLAAYTVLVTEAFDPIFYGWGKVADRHGVAGLFNHVAQLALISRRE